VRSSIKGHYTRNRGGTKKKSVIPKEEVWRRVKRGPRRTSKRGKESYSERIFSTEDHALGRKGTASVREALGEPYENLRCLLWGDCHAFAVNTVRES